MKNAHIRILIVLAAISLLGAVGTQVLWINRAITKQDQLFNHSVHVALREVVASLCAIKGKDYPVVNPIEQITDNYYIVRTNDHINLANLEYLLTAKIHEHNILQEFTYGVYDCLKDQMIFAESIDTISNLKNSKLPILPNEEYYFGVHFPNKSTTHIAGLDILKFTTSITAIVIVFFSYALFVILKQKRLSEVQKDFINNVTHELKTPLSVLSLASQSLSVDKKNKNGQYQDIIIKEVNRLEEKVEQILHASRADVRNPIVLEAVNVRDMIETLMMSHHLQMSNKKIEWHISGETPRPICLSVNLLKRVLINLLDNAVKYGASNIKITLQQQPKRTILSISDDGRGIAKKDIKHIFTKFYRVPEPNHTHSVKGFGLGLHIVKRALRTMKAKIDVTSTLHVGSTFKITLPHV